MGELGDGDDEGKGAGAGATVSLCSQLRGARPTERATARAAMAPRSLARGAAELGDADGKGAGAAISWRLGAQRGATEGCGGDNRRRRRAIEGCGGRGR